MSALRTIVAKKIAPHTKRWVCDDCKAQVQGVTYGRTELFGPCLCAGWTAADNVTLAETVARLMQEGHEVRP